MDKNGYRIIYRRINYKSTSHINYLKEREPRFCVIHPYIININLHPTYKVVAFDGEYFVEIDSWSGIGIGFSNPIKNPPQDLVDSVHNYICEEVDWF
jgi:hypothetical protein